jgi:hypothetical protein
MTPNLTFQSLLGALSLTVASASFAAQPLPVNPMLLDALTPAAPRVVELSLPALEDRLRETKAIPVARKIELMSEVDALLEQFRQAYSTGNPELSTLREPYTRLMTKMQVLVKKDQRLARDIAASKEPIWESLVDRSQFASLD